MASPGGGNGVVPGEAAAAPEAPGKSGEDSGLVCIVGLDKAGIRAELETMKSEAECKAGTKEELPIDSDTSVVFQKVCETGLREEEIHSKGQRLPYSVRNTLNVFLENKRSHKRERIYSFSCNYTDWVLLPLGPEGRPERCYDYPYVLDAEVSADGRLLRFLVYHSIMVLKYYQIDLTKEDRTRQVEERWAPTVFQKMLTMTEGSLLQAYFVKPDVVNVSTMTMEYSVRIRRQNGRLYRLKNNIPKDTELPGTVTYCDCIYWNGKGHYDYLKALFLRKQIYDPSWDGYSKADDFPRPIGKEPPVPTQKDWKGWRKLERDR